MGHFGSYSRNKLWWLLCPISSFPFFFVMSWRNNYNLRQKFTMAKRCKFWGAERCSFVRQKKQIRGDGEKTKICAQNNEKTYICVYSPRKFVSFRSGPHIIVYSPQQILRLFDPENLRLFRPEKTKIIVISLLNNETSKWRDRDKKLWICHLPETLKMSNFVYTKKTVLKL